MNRKNTTIIQRYIKGCTSLCLLFFLLPLSAVAQTVKPIAVSNETPYIDHITLKPDSKDMDLMVKFAFNEKDNSLTMSLISYRSLFVFREDARYKEVIKGRTLQPEKFPYVVTADEGQKFKLTSDYRRSIVKPRKKHIFKRWYSYQGLVPAPTEYQMVNDYIEQKFDIKGQLNNVSITLREVFLMDQDSKQENRYWIVFGKDLNTEYQITIQRNPCFGQEAVLDNAQKSLDAIKKSYKSLKSKYGKGTVSSEDGKKAFDELKSTLTAQYQPTNDSSACADIQQCFEQYNLYADSLASLKVNVVTPADASEHVMGSKGSEANAKIVLANARLIDNKVAQWLNSQDTMERMDIISTCRNIIKDTKMIISTLSATEWRETIKVFNNAEQYFKKTCR